MLLWLIRGCFVILVTVIAGLIYQLFVENHAVAALLSGATIIILAGVILTVDLREREKDIRMISALGFGMLIGLLIANLLGIAIDPLVKSFAISLGEESSARLSSLLRVLVTVFGCYVGISTFVQTRNEFRFIIPYVEFSKQSKGPKPLVLDTSVIIDGRIAELCETRLIDTKLIVPRFVLNELQAVADSADKLKRNRGRRGLDILKKIQSNNKIDVQIQESGPTEAKGADKGRVDERLVMFAKAIGGRVVTNDFNLNKIAQLQGVEVINLNEIANTLKTVALPGEYLTVRVIKAGDQAGQGVGYLDDGTMIVIEQGRGSIGTEVSIVVTSVLQNPAGRMIFGRIEARPSGAYSPVGSGGSTTTLQPVTGSASGTHQPVGSSTNTSVIKPTNTDPPPKN